MKVIKNKFTLAYHDKNVEKNFLDTIAKAKKTQMLFTMALTFSLYILYILLDIYALDDQKYLSLYFHASMLVLWVYLIFTTYYDLGKIFSKLILFLMPPYAISMTLYIASITTPVYITEIYVILFWVFIAIGYTFFESLIIGTLIAFISIFATYTLEMISFESFLIHLFHVFTAWTLGILAGYRIELYSRNNYEKQLEILSIKNELESLNHNLEDKIKAESKLATKNLTEQAYDLHRAQSLAKIGSWRYRINEDILSWSDETYNIFQIDARKHEIKTMNDYISRIDGTFSQESTNAYAKHLKDGSPYNLVHQLLLADGTKKWIKEECDTFYNNEGVAIVSNGIVQDITQIKEQELSLLEAKMKAEESAVAKSEFLSSMSHEIRTPLNAILGFVTILKKMIKEEKAKGYLDIINSSGNSLLTIINDILDVSKMQSGKFEITKNPVCPLEELSNTIMLFTSNSYAKHHAYTVYIDPKLPKSINIDITRVNQILSNLLSNSIKFTPMYGAINVSITYKEASLILSIQDTGIGIAKENIDKIFSAFSQADSSTTRRFGGTGLGLSISSSLAKLMQGTLTVKSEEGVGSIFTLTLPAETIEEEPLELINTQDISKLKFAILNNNKECEPSVKLIEKYLKDFGAQIISLLDSYQENGYDVLFFVPDDEYNDEIVKSQIPTVVMLRDDTVKIEHIEHINPLYAPFIPKSVTEVLSKTINVSSQIPTEIDIQDDEEIQFKGHVLIAEDNVTNQMLIKLLMMDYNITFEIANDGVEALELFKKYKFDIVLMDENMPNKNGIEAMREIKAYEKENSLTITPIIALTANALETDRARFKEAGMDGFIAKPIDNQALVKELTKYLEFLPSQ